MGPNSLEIMQEVKEVEKFVRSLIDFMHKSPNSNISKKLELIKFQFNIFFG